MPVSPCLVPTFPSVCFTSNDYSEITLLYIHHPRIGLFFLNVFQLNCPADIVGQRSAQTSRLQINLKNNVAMIAM